MKEIDDAEDLAELDNLLYDNHIALGRAREFMVGFASACEVEKNILREELAQSAANAEPMKQSEPPTPEHP